MAGKPGRPRKERPEGEEDSDKIWGVRGVHDMTRQAVKMYALRRNLPVGAALEDLVAMGLALYRHWHLPGETGMLLRNKDVLYKAIEEAMEDLLGTPLDKDDKPRAQ